MPRVPGLRSPYVKVGRLVYFGRLLDKIRLHARGQLPPDYVANLGDTRPGLFDARCCRFLGVRHADLAARTHAGGTDDDLLTWAHQHGTRRSDDDCDVWNQFMMKLGWRDDRTPVLHERIATAGLGDRDIHTMFDFIDFDEGRDPVRRRAWELRPAQIALVMGVAGSGKTTIGRAVADSLGWRFADADDFHPPANVAKMAAGTPLDDHDRGPWLMALRDHIKQCLHQGESAVVACSALKAIYRDVLLVDPDRVMIIYLRGTPELLRQRLQARPGHFMKPAMLDSQLAALEEPAPAEALICDIAEPPAALVAQIRAALED